MTIRTMNQLPTRLDVTGTTVVLVRGGTAPARPAETVTVSPSVSATAGIDGRRAPLYVSADAQSGKTVRQFDYEEVPAAADCAARFVAERDPTSLWLCGRERLVAWWSERTARAVERRLAATTLAAEVPLVVWTERDGEPDRERCTGEDRPTDGDRDDADTDAERYDEIVDA